MSTIPVILLLLALGAVYVGTIETAFSALMRLSLRFMAERGTRADRLAFYLDDPILLFVPARLMLGLTSDAGGRHRGEPPRKTFIAGRTTAAVGDRHAQATVGIHRTIRTP